jgi:hypothetical protein
MLIIVHIRGVLVILNEFFLAKWFEGTHLRTLGWPDWYSKI